MLVCQLSARKGLRDLVENLKAQVHKLYQLGMKKVTRATLARVMDSVIFFVARLKDNALLEYSRKRPGRKAKGVVQDQEIMLKGINSKLRLVRFIADDGNEYRFVTNAFHLKADVVAELYKKR
jgi:hypothetical protein